MNSNPYAVPAIVLGAVMIIACITGLLWVSYARRPAGGRHARHPEPVPFADPADAADPDGGQFVQELAGASPDYCTGYDHPGWDDEDEIDAGWWAQQPPMPPVVEVLTGPAAKIAHTSAMTLNVLTRVRDALRDLGADGGDPAIDDTGQLPVAVCTWGKTAPELADELAAKYLAAPQ